MNRAEKREFVETFKEDLPSSSLFVITRQIGLSVAESSDLRNRMRDAGARFKVVKNSLVKIAIRESKLSSLDQHLTGPTALAYSADPVAAARVAVKYMDENPKFSVVAGVMGESFLDLEALKTLANLPSLDELRATILGVLSAPATKLAILIKEPGASLARVISAYSKR